MTRLYADEAELYDIAFDWDVADEVGWLLERLAGARRVLEPGCGSGRILHALAARGVDAVGIDLSTSMIALSEQRLRGSARVVRADMCDFGLGETFDGAVCPIGTLGHLPPNAATRHLECMARHLRRNRRYLVQLALRTDELLGGSSWEVERGGTRVKVDYAIVEADLRRGVSRERSRIAILSGPRAGEVIEEEHGSSDERPGVALGTPGPLMWHELTVRG